MNEEVSAETTSAIPDSKPATGAKYVEWNSKDGELQTSVADFMQSASTQVLAVVQANSKGLRTRVDGSHYSLQEVTGTRSVAFMALNPVSLQLIVGFHPAPKAANQQPGLILWDLASAEGPDQPRTGAPRAPRKPVILACKSTPTCATWGVAAHAGGHASEEDGSASRVAIAGCKEGTLCMWDLRGPLKGVPVPLPGTAERVQNIWPSCCTEFSHETNATDEVVAVRFVRCKPSSNATGGRQWHGRSPPGTLGHVLVLMKDGVIVVWRLHQFGVGDGSVGVERTSEGPDFGVRAGASLRLSRLAVGLQYGVQRNPLLAATPHVPPSAAIPWMSNGILFTSLATNPFDGYEFMVGDGRGNVHRGFRFPCEEIPKEYKLPLMEPMQCLTTAVLGPATHVLPPPHAVTAIAYHPFVPGLFAVVYLGEGLAVYHTAQGIPLHSDQALGDLKAAVWARHSPSSLILTHNGGSVATYSLLDDPVPGLHPVYQPEQDSDRVTCVTQLQGPGDPLGPNRAAEPGVGTSGGLLLGHMGGHVTVVPIGEGKGKWGSAETEAKALAEWLGVLETVKH